MMTKNNNHIWPQLYQISKTGKVKLWLIKTEENKIIIEHGYENSKLVKQEKIIYQGKNIGKINETSPEEQAFKEANAKWLKQLDLGYEHNKLKLGQKSSYFPMLADTCYYPNHPKVKDGSKKITKLPKHIILQPKLNGVRAIAVKKDYEVKLYSRRNKIYDVPKKLIKELNQWMVNNEIWDGEIYVHGWDLTRIISAVKKYNNDTKLLEFHRYDVPSFKNETMFDRTDIMEFLVKTRLIKQVESCDVKVKFDIWKILKEKHDHFVNNGYEGLIIRDAKAKYVWKHRGSHMYKYKDFTDEEFKIIGYRQGSGTADGAVCWKCRCEPKIKDRLWPGQRYEYFDVVPNGAMEHRRKLFKNGWRFIGKMLTVRFFEYTIYGVPLFPKGVAIRDYE